VALSESYSTDLAERGRLIGCGDESQLKRKGERFNFFLSIVFVWSLINGSLEGLHRLVCLSTHPSIQEKHFKSVM
jgi:hypothetical protein